MLIGGDDKFLWRWLGSPTLAGKSDGRETNRVKERKIKKKGIVKQIEKGNIEGKKCKKRGKLEFEKN